jgi:serine/threonine protein kinase/tetratricopeptide (TPR) repeat protein
MTAQPIGRFPSLDALLEAYEQDQSAHAGTDDGPDLAPFLPPPDHPQFDDALLELVRLDLEYGFARGRPTPLEDYRRRFPRLFSDPGLLRELVFEEFRLRLQSEQHPSVEEYQRLYGIDVTDRLVTPPGPQGLVEANDPRGVQHETAVRPSLQLRQDPSELPLSHIAAADFEVNPVPGEAPAPQLEDAFVTAADRLEPGADFLGFRLIRELGRGAFGRVYLAEQGNLANRLVALKVSTALFGEPQTLARLQHTNIVPIYSVHQAGPVQAVCMPWLGAVTLGVVCRKLQGGQPLPSSGHDLVQTLLGRGNRLLPSQPNQTALAEGIVPAPGEAAGLPTNESSSPSATLRATSLETLGRLTWVQAVLWLGARLAEGLAHAHERGILHLDIKPSNVLLADDGQPMLLDFNLAQDTVRSSVRARVGGTLPYMSPEQLAQFAGDGPEARCTPRGQKASRAPGGSRPSGPLRFSRCCTPRGQKASRTRPSGPLRATASPLDGRSDVYSLGLLLFELLTGQLPFAVIRGPSDDLPGQFLERRLAPPPRLRCLNRAISPAVEAIIRRCLEPDPSHRYPSARALADDLQRQLVHLPLQHTREPLQERARKWVLRHPRWTTAAAVGGAAVMIVLVLIAVLVGLRRQHRDELARQAELQSELQRQHQADLARQAARQFTEDKHTADFLLNGREPDQTHLDAGIHQARRALARHRILQGENWFESPLVLALPADERQRLQEEAVDLLYTLARATALQAARAPESSRGEMLRQALQWNRRAERSAPRLAPERSPRSEEAGRSPLLYQVGRIGKAVLVQRINLLEQLGGTEEAKILSRESDALQPRTARDHFLLAVELVDRGQARKAAPLFKEAIRRLDLALRRDSRDFWSWYLLGNCHDRLLHNQAAHTCYTVCLALKPDCYEAAFNRALACCRERRWPEACADFSRAIELAPQRSAAWFQRALAETERGNHQRARDDLSRALELGFPETRVYFLRAAVLDRLGDKEAAGRDRQMGLRLAPADEHSWLERGVARLRQKDSRGALADFEQALKMNPGYLPALQNKAHVLALAQRNEEALLVMEQAVRRYPDFVPARLGRGVLLARLGKRAEAHREARAALDRDGSPATLYQASNIFALTARQQPEDRLDALPLLRRALGAGFGLDIIDSDSDMDPIRDHADFRRIVKAARELASRR